MTGEARSLEAWFARQAERERGAVRLEDALLGGRFARYFVHRLRFFGLRYVVAATVQLVKVLVIHRLLDTAGFFALVALVAAVGIASGGWWGALEVLRARVRRLYRFESPAVVGREIARWVAAAAAVGCAILLVGLLVLALRAVGRGEVEPLDLALLAVLVRFALDLPVRAYHGGAFALRRVYRPWGSIIVLEALGLGTLLALSPSLGAWAIGLAELVMAAAFAAIALRYAARTHRLLGLAPHRQLQLPLLRRRGSPGRRRRRSFGGRGRLPLKVTAELARPALAGMAMSLDNLVVVATIGVATAAREPGLALLAAAIAPTVRAGFDWSQLVYFDLNRLDAPLFVNLRRRLDAATLRLALVLGCGLSVVALAVAVGPLALRGEITWALPPFLVGASVLGLSQMQAFTAGAYWRSTLGGLVLVAALVVLRPLAGAGLEPLAVLAASTIVAAVTVRLADRARTTGRSDPGPLLPTAWLTRLRSEGSPVIVGALRIRASEPTGGGGLLTDPTAVRDWRIGQVGRGLAERAGGRGAVTVLGAGLAAWYVRADFRPAITSRTVVLEAAGRVPEIWQTDAENGSAAIAALEAWPVFQGDPSLAGHRPGGPTGDDAVVQRFRELVPGGFTFRPAGDAPGVLARLDPVDRRVVLADAVRHARSLSVHPGRRAWDVTSWCPDGTLRVVFLAPRSAGGRTLRRWRAWIRARNLAAASDGRLPANRHVPGRLTRSGTVWTPIREPVPSALATSVATELRHG